MYVYVYVCTMCVEMIYSFVVNVHSSSAFTYNYIHHHCVFINVYYSQLYISVLFHDNSDLNFFLWDCMLMVEARLGGIRVGLYWGA